MKIKVLFDKDRVNNKLSIGWGVSFLIDNRILFDTGESGEYLLNNMELMNIDISKIKSVVISHDHWDHTGGLWGLLKKNKDIKVYGCPGFSKEFRNKVKKSGADLNDNKKFTKICNEVYVTGEIPGKYNDEFMPEQALVIRNKKGLTVITGCSHPGIIEMLYLIKMRFAKEKFHMVFGGFHLKNKSLYDIKKIVRGFKELGVKKSGPTHCTGNEAVEAFSKEYGDDFIPIKVGQVLEI